MNSNQDRSQELDTEAVSVAQEPFNELGGDASADKKQKGKESSKAFMEMIAKVESLTTIEDKITLCVEFMKLSLVDSATPKFRDFWDARRFCLPFFREQMSAKFRTQFWQEYVDLSVEARRLKEMLDEQSAFAFEQIDLAIDSLIADLQKYSEKEVELPSIVFPEESTVISSHIEQYSYIQGNLHLLNTFASRINSLRKEVIRTEMRVKNKNKLFEKLSVAGDLVFPKRKDWIKEVSNMFIADVDATIQKYFEGEMVHPLHGVREEIKSLQTIAKILTINAHAFTETRMKLSQCWDKLKFIEKERKKQFQEKRQVSKQNFDLVSEKIKQFEELCLAASSSSEVENSFNEIFSFMKTLELSFGEQKILKEQLIQLRKPLLDKERELRAQKEEEIKQAQLQRKHSIEEFKSNMDQCISNASILSLEEMEGKLQGFQSQLLKLEVNKSERMLLEKGFKSMKDLMDERREERLLHLSEQDQQQREELKQLLVERKKRRAEIKGQIEFYRKSLGGSGFDFEKAMMYRDLLQEEKDSLEKIDQSIEEIQHKIEEIEG